MPVLLNTVLCRKELKLRVSIRSRIFLCGLSNFPFNLHSTTFFYPSSTILPIRRDRKKLLFHHTKLLLRLRYVYELKTRIALKMNDFEHLENRTCWFAVEVFLPVSQIFIWSFYSFLLLFMLFWVICFKFDRT